jgi:uncharacterized membrane protein/Mg-chelatase subunit ChlD
MNGLQKFFRRIFPPPFKPVRWGAAIPFALFAVLMALLCFSILPTFLVRSGSPGLWNRTFIEVWGVKLVSFQFLANWSVPLPVFEVIWEHEFVRPWAFLLLLATPWIWWMQAAGHSGLPEGRGAVAGFIRLMIAGLLIIVLAEPRAVKTSDVVSVIYNVDVSDSVNESRADALNLVAETAGQKPATDQAGLVVFGRTAAVELPPRETFPFEKYINSQVSQDATNLEQSLALSAAMLPEENVGRIVLISDGTETVGQLEDIIDDLQARDVQVDVWPIEYKVDKEVLLERLDLPRFVKQGETYDATVVLSSLTDGRGTLVLQEGSQTIARQDVEFKAGKSRYSIPIKVDQPAYYEYSAKIEMAPTEDTRSENNEVRNYLRLEGPGRILIVTEPGDEPKEWEPIKRALEQGERLVDVISAFDFPLDPLKLQDYDAVLFVNVPADSLLSNQIQALHDGIKNLGIGFMMVGGPNSFGPGGWQGSLIADALPVSMEISNKKILPKGALAIILHTCEFPQGNSWAKRITKRAIQVLNSEDLCGVLAQTETGDDWIFELTPAKKYAELVPIINDAQIGDMGTFATTMQLGIDALIKSDAAARHMIIISDGDASPPSPQLLQKFVDNGVTVSTVAVFPHNGDVSIMEAIAGATGGKFYYPNDPNQLPSIFVKEAKTLRRNQLQIRDFLPVLTNVDPMLKDIAESPMLKGYVLTSPKDDPRATIVLSAPPTESEIKAGETDPDPILAVWRYGLGVTAAFTSDLNERWGKNWTTWDQYQQLVNQMVTRISRTNSQTYLRVYTYVNGNEGVVVVEDFHPEESLLDVNVTVVDGDKFKVTQPVRQIAPRRYQTTIPLNGEGRYQVIVDASGRPNPAVDADGNPTKSETAFAGFIVSYSPEYLRFRPNPIVLNKIADETKGRELNKDAEMKDIAAQIYGERKPKRSSQPIFEWYLMVLACLLPLDVAVRRVQIDLSQIKKLFKRNTKESTAKLGSLLQRTTELRSQLNNQRDPDAARSRQETPAERPMQPRPPMPRPTSGSTPQPPQNSQPTPPAPESPPPADGGTTSRLLALKKRREEGKND